MNDEELLSELNEDLLDVTALAVSSFNAHRSNKTSEQRAEEIAKEWELQVKISNAVVSVFLGYDFPPKRLRLDGESENMVDSTAKVIE